MQHEFKNAASCPVREGERHGRRIAKHFGIARVVPFLRRSRHQPAFPECGAAEFDAELFANETSPSIAGNQILSGNLGGAHPRAAKPDPQYPPCRKSINSVLNHASERVSFDGVRAEIISQLLLEHRLAKGVQVSGSRILSWLGGRAENTIPRAETIGTVTQNNARENCVGHSDRLHRPKRLVVNRNCAGFLDGRLVPLDQQNVNAVTREKICSGEPVRPCSHNHDGPYLIWCHKAARIALFDGDRIHGRTDRPGDRQRRGAEKEFVHAVLSPIRARAPSSKNFCPC